MSTVTAAPTAPGRTAGADAALQTPATSFARLTAIELRKMADTRAGFWLLVSIALLIVAAAVVRGATVDAADRSFRDFFEVVQWPVGILLPVLGILSVTSEWSQRTALTTFTLVPNRFRVVGAKIAAAIALAAAALVVALVVAVVANLVGGGDWGFGAMAVVQALVFQLAGILGGLAFGLLFQASAPAIIAYYVLPTIVSIVVSIVNALEDVARWIDTGQTLAPLVEGTPSGTEWARVATSVALWVLLPLALGLWRLPRSEVK
jgi:ABC-type transport system involved in multi-copper enzyme maturation permease subunit